VNLAWALANQRRFPEALANFEQASRLEPDSADLEFKWGLALAMNGQTTDGLRHLARAVHLQPENPAMHSGYGRVLLQSGRSTAAMSEFEEVLRLDPGSQEARRILDQLRGAATGAQ
jgi:Flp pilus assembly protein TadD